MQDKSPTKLAGELEVDESFIGGKPRNMHKSVRARRVPDERGPSGKAVALGMVERGGKVRTFAVLTHRKYEIQPRIRASVQAGSALFNRLAELLQGYARVLARHRRLCGRVCAETSIPHHRELLESGETPTSWNVHQCGTVPSVPVSR
jgi:hypothetical protein